MADYNLRSNRRRNKRSSGIDLFNPQLFKGGGDYDGIQDSEDSEDSTEFFNPKEYFVSDRKVRPRSPPTNHRKRRHSPSSSDFEETDRPIIPIGNRLFEILTNGD